MSQCLSWAQKTKRIIVWLVLVSAVIFFVLPQLTLAQLGLEYATVTGLGTTNLKVLIFRIINVVLGFLGIVAMIIVLYGGFVWMTAGGNEQKISQAKKILVNGVIGLAIILASWSIVSFLLWMLTGQGLFGPSGPSGPPPGPGAGQGTLGLGIIESHYPGRNTTGIPRNTKIIITFKEPMDGGTLIDNAGTPADPSDDQINSNNVKIGVKNSGIFLTNAEVAALVLPGNKTFIFDPVNLLGSPSEDVWYRVQLTNGILKANGQIALSTGYSWDFQVSTFVDTTPPQITKIRPAKNSTNPRNIIIQINFSEAIDPSSASGKTSAGFNNIIVDIDNDPNNGNEVAGTFEISNQYQTVEFIPEQECGLNSCGTIIYCLPANANLQVTVKAATGANLPEADFPYDGVVDMASNSLDGDADSTAEGPPTDNYLWQFQVTDTIDTTPPQVLAVEPKFQAEGVRLNIPVRVLFDSPMSYRTLNSSNITLNSYVNYWLFSQDDHYCLDINNNGIKFCSQDMDCNGGGSCSSEEITLTTINHDRFTVKTQYNVNLNQEVQDAMQNCFVPARKCENNSDCLSDNYSCCEGFCVNAPDCFNP